MAQTRKTEPLPSATPLASGDEREHRVLELLGRVGLDADLVRSALTVFALSRLGFVILTLVVLQVSLHVPLTLQNFIDAWYRRDATYFGRIAASGYSGTNVAFFPLQPLAIRIVSPIVGGNMAAAGLVVSNLSFVVALLGLAALVGHEVDAGTTRRAMLYLTLFPSALFLFAGYSEALFLAVCIWCFVCIRRGWWWQAGVLGLLASLTRQAGVMLVLPFAWEYGKRIGWQVRNLRPSAFAVALIPMGPLLFMVWLWHAVGDPLAFVSVQAHWGRSFTLPWITLYRALRELPQQADQVLLVRGLVDLFAVLLIGGLIIYGARRMPLGDTLFSAAILVLALSSPSIWWPLLSDARFMLAAFPCFVLLAREGRRPWLNILVLAVFAVLLVILTQYFVSGNIQIV